MGWIMHAWLMCHCHCYVHACMLYIYITWLLLASFQVSTPQQTKAALIFVNAQDMQTKTRTPLSEDKVPAAWPHMLRNIRTYHHHYHHCPFSVFPLGFLPECVYICICTRSKALRFKRGRRKQNWYQVRELIHLVFVPFFWHHMFQCQQSKLTRQY